MKKLNVGVIGAGSISEVHFNGYAKNQDVIISAVCDLDEQRAQEKALKHGATKVFTDYRLLLSDSEIDAVSICTWNNSHAEICIAALEAGKHILVEKPLCKTVAEAERILETVRQTGHGKIVQVGFVRRYSSNAQIVKQFLDSGELGEIYYAKATFLRRVGNPGGWFSDIERSGGGPLIDLGIHIIDLCWYLMGRPKVKSVRGNTYKKLGSRPNIRNLAFYKPADYDESTNTVEDLANAIICFENGASILVDVSFTLHAKQDEISIKIYGDKGGAEIEPELTIITERHDTILNATPQVDHLTFDFTDAFNNEINHFVDACLGRKETLSPVEDGVEMMKILCGIYESAEKNREIHFE